MDEIGSPFTGPSPLTLAEAVLLLALDDKGKIPGGLRHTTFGLRPKDIDLALAAALITELARQGRIRMAGTKTIEVADPAPIGSPLADEVLSAMAADGGPRKAHAWLKRLPRRVDALRERVAAQLAERGVVSLDGGRDRFPILDADAVEGVRRRLREALLGEENPEPSTLELVRLGVACGRSFSVAVPKNQRKQANFRGQALMGQGEPVGMTVAAAVRSYRVGADVAGVAGAAAGG